MPVKPNDDYDNAEDDYEHYDGYDDNDGGGGGGGGVCVCVCVCVFVCFERKTWSRMLFL